jgi:hypothetical protein
MAYPTPVVKLTFSSSVNWLTNSRAFAYASAHSSEPDAHGEGYLGGENARGPVLALLKGRSRLQYGTYMGSIS